MDSSWFHSDLNPERFRCLAAMVERGLNITESNVEHLTATLDGAAAEGLLFAENSPLEVQSRLVQYAFLHAATRGHYRVVSKLLQSDVLNTMSEMPDLDYIQGLYKSNAWLYCKSLLYDNIPETSTTLRLCALVLALSSGQYGASSLLIEHGVATYISIRLLAASSSVQRHL
jgi:hypothetical protein